MRPLGLLGAPLSGAPPFAGLGAGPPSAGTYLRGDGAWAPVSSGALSLIATGSPAGAATLDFVNVFSASYDDYLLVIDNLVPATNDVILQMLFGTGSTPTWQTSSYVHAEVTAGFTGPGGVTTTPYMDGEYNVGSIRSMGTHASWAGWHWSNNAAAGLRGNVLIFSPLSTTLNKFLQFDLCGGGAGASGQNAFQRSSGGGQWYSTTAVTSLRMQFSSGNIASGKVRLYGIANS